MRPDGRGDGERMGGAMAAAWATAFRVLVYDPNATPLGTERVRSLDKVDVDGIDIVVLAVKPQIFRETTSLLAPIARRALVLSIMAGVVADHAVSASERQLVERLEEVKSTARLPLA